MGGYFKQKSLSLSTMQGGSEYNDVYVIIYSFCKNNVSKFPQLLLALYTELRLQPRMIVCNESWYMWALQEQLCEQDNSENSAFSAI